MATLVLDPALPVDNSPLVSGEMRGQFQAILDRFDAGDPIPPIAPDRI